MATLGLSCSTWDLHCGIGIFSCSMRDLVPWPGTEPGPPALGAWSLSHWTTREVPKTPFFDITLSDILVSGCSQIPRSYGSVSDSPTRGLGVLVEVSIPPRPLAASLLAQERPSLLCALLFSGLRRLCNRGSPLKRLQGSPKCLLLYFLKHLIGSKWIPFLSPSLHRITCWIPEISFAWKVDWKDVGVGTPWVAAFLDSFSKGKPAAQVMLGLQSCLFQQNHGFLEGSLGSNSVNVKKRRAHGRGLPGSCQQSRLREKSNRQTHRYVLRPRGGQSQVQVLSTESGSDSQHLCDLGC